MDKKKVILISIILIIIVLVIFIYLNYFRTYTVTFNTQLGPGIKTQEVKKGNQVIKPSDPTYEGYTFMGWYLDNEEYDFNTPVNSNLTLDAKWEETN